MSHIVNEAISLSKSKYLKEIKELNSYEDIKLPKRATTDHNDLVVHDVGDYYFADGCVGIGDFRNAVSSQRDWHSPSEWCYGA